MNRRSTRLLVLITALAAALAAAPGAGSSAGSSPAVAAGATHTACSAAGLPAGRPVARLPRAVASMRLRIIAAARRCDYRALVRLGDERGRGFTFSYGATMTAPLFWRMLERNGSKPPPMAALVKILAMPFAAVRADGTTAPAGAARYYVWPSVHRTRPTARDWRPLRTLYTQAQIDAMRRGGTGYLGYRVGITPSGDWQYFVAGD